MVKKILVISYSQTGQLHEILNNFLEPFEKADIEQVIIQPKEAYAFPWTSASFFDVMPETVFEEAIELMPYELQSSTYDLVILGYQPWFLSPSLPLTALLQDPSFLAILKNTPVVTVIGSRNMWINSQKSVVQRIQDAGGELVANIPLIDKNQNLISALTILHWMLNGKKDRKWGILPYPGVAQKDIDEVGIFGKTVSDAFQKNNFEGLQKAILSYNKIDLSTSIMLIESKAKRLFRIWANLIRKKGTTEKKRSFWLVLYKYYLVIALFVVSPIVLIIYTIFVLPFIWKKVQKQKEELLYLGIKK